MPREFRRSRRIEEQIQRILSDVIRAEVRDPRLRQLIVTDVEVSRDLSVAWLAYTTMDSEQSRDELHEALNAAGGFLRKRLAGELHTRGVPELRFRFDDSLDRGAALEKLIDDAVSKDHRIEDQADDGNDEQN